MLPARYILVLSGIIFSVIIHFTLKSLLSDPTTPHLENIWWGDTDKSKIHDETIKSFQINISKQILDDLEFRLKHHRTFIPSLENVSQQYGINSKLLDEIIEYWKNDYKWSERQNYLNKFPQFTTQIQGLTIHFLRVKPNIPKSRELHVLPLLLLHGWPGSVREFYEIIPLLTTPQKDKNFVFDIIAPSLPGYGFSEATRKPGLGAAQVAMIMKNLMNRLGFNKFYVQGGDWGSIIGTTMSIMYPSNVRGLHINLCFSSKPISQIIHFFGSLYPKLVVEDEYQNLLYPLSSFFHYLISETGYLHLQATKPDTIGVSLNDSPVGLAAYIIEKFITWTNKEWIKREDGGLKEKFSYADLLDNVMIYWITGSITTSMRLYSETFNKDHTSLQLDRISVNVPTACAKFKNELVYSPDLLLKQKYPNLIHSVTYNDGGHFAAFELPQILAEDIWTAIQKIEENYSKNRDINNQQ
ncbi:juvenile hormone epoxide hydrolase 2-like [Agrilus planipennis]|uniref:Epoxide hydrolase n=1 Tax=Agrilus planipennis TaxID=224129 RepID=A0A1W4XE43_AGRPL|nr:juvenile hormone epoxide hydrolase 2-like [Agrilus planipennis]XP_018330719.1 juvenile hormone epoxide hydrolase 2-like [Agrilus planipennis]